jgi:hypothetical protein
MKVDDRIRYNPRHSGREGFDRNEPITIAAVEEENNRGGSTFVDDFISVFAACFLPGREVNDADALAVEQQVV